MNAIGCTLVATLLLAGCARTEPPAKPSDGTQTSQAEQDPFTFPPSFRKATRPPYHALPAGTETITGKSLAGLMRKMLALWEKVRFRTPDGKHAIRYRALLQTDAGTIELGFYPKEAPNHCRSFIALAKAGFYDGLLFHRVSHSPGLKVIQGGCPLGNGGGGPGYCLRPEFNAHKHVTGALSAARSTPKDSAGSQFFICSGENAGLDTPANPYTVFGYVTKGQDIVNKIATAPVQGPNRDQPVDPICIRQVVVKEEKVPLSAASQPGT